MTNERELLAVRVKEYRKDHNLNQLQFAQQCRITLEALKLIEDQRGDITFDTVQLLATQMGIELSDLLSSPQITYFVIPEEMEVDGEIHTTYGIGAICNDVLVENISDVSTELNKIKNFVQLCNKENLSLTHLKDVVEDFLT